MKDFAYSLRRSTSSDPGAGLILPPTIKAMAVALARCGVEAEANSAAGTGSDKNQPVIGHMKAEQRMDRNYLKRREGDRINAVLAATGYNFGLLLPWLAHFLHALILILKRHGLVAAIA